MSFRYADQDHVCVSLDDAIVEVKCGLHPWERFPERPNRLKFSIQLYARLHGPKLEGSGFIDYDPIRQGILALPSRPHIDLLETIVDELVAICFADPRVEACRVGVRKPDIFNEAAGAGVDVFRNRPV